MAIKDDASLSEMAWELEVRLSELEGRLASIQDSQSLLSRRHEEHWRMSYDAFGGLFILLMLMWSGLEFRWWYGLIAMALLLALYYVRAGAEIKERKRHQPASAEADPS